MTMHAQVTVGRVAVTVANVNTALIEYEGQPVCTTRQLAGVDGCAEKNLADNFQNNACRFEEGKHFVKLEGAALRRFKHEIPDNTGDVPERTARLILWTEKGAARHAKMLSTETAWRSSSSSKTFTSAPRVRRSRSAISTRLLMAWRSSAAPERSTSPRARPSASVPSSRAGDPARQVIFAKIINPIAGSDVLALPALAERTYCAAEVGERFGITAAMVGRIANQHGLKTPDYGQHVLDKSAHSAKLVEAFRYNERGAARIGELASAAVEPAATNRRVRPVEPQGRQLFERGAGDVCP